MAFLDDDRRFTKVNAACTALWGYREAELLERDIFAILVPDDLGLTRQVAARTDAGTRSFRREVRWTHRNGSIITTKNSVTPLTGADGRSAGVFVQHEDVTVFRALEARLRELADHDEVTGLYNRRALRAAIERHLMDCARYGITGALIMIDLDSFKDVNDRFGHAEGDLVLAAVADVMRRTLRSTDHLARYAGDEFAVLMPEQDVHAAVTSETMSVDRLLASADYAMYKAKNTAGTPTTSRRQFADVRGRRPSRSESRSTCAPRARHRAA